MELETSFFYINVTREKLLKRCFVRKIRTFNIDEIDYRESSVLCLM